MIVEYDDDDSRWKFRKMQQFQGRQPPKSNIIEDLKDVTHTKPKHIQVFCLKVEAAINIEIEGRFITERCVCLPFIHLDQHSFRHNNH